MEIVVILFILVILFLSFVFSSPIPKKYLKRNCMGKEWKEKFPDIPKEDIRLFLTIFADSFLFSKKFKLHFKPSDKILDIYDKIYPLKGIDSLELETLELKLKEKYKINIRNIWNKDITLGQLCAFVCLTKR